MVNVNINAAIFVAREKGDKKELEKLEAIADLAKNVRLSGDTKGATGIAKFGAAGGPVIECGFVPQRRLRDIPIHERALGTRILYLYHFHDVAPRSAV
jgi:hypothetical protein